MRRRILAGGAVGLTLVLALAACGSAEPDEPAAVAASRSLTVWVDEARAGALEGLAGSYGAEAGIAIDVVPQTSETLRDGYVRAVTQGEGPDVLIGAHDWLGELVTNGVVQPVDLADADAFAPAAVEAMTYDGVTYGMPLSIESVALVRNDALATTTPATFGEVVAQGEALVAEGRATRPLLVQQGDGGDPYHMYPVQTSFGAPAFRADEEGSYTTELALGGDGGRAFAEFLADLAERDVLDPAVTSDVATQGFLAGESPYILTGPWSTAAFAEAGMDISVLPVPPAGDLPAQPFVGVQGAFVNNLSLHQDAARAFVGDFLATPEAQLALYRATSRAPALTAALDEITDDPITTGFADAGAQGAPMPAIPQMGMVWLYWGSTEASIARGEGDPAALWDQMVANIEASIAAEL
ncbi:maltose ABC transporter substrate-binding protein [Cellulomonas cellasea]|uniref:Arabinogalactan oligomer/maltooligosaccharide transport system substrate-binding protein n=1 Tax=Cellulomonas cellasea TaxID=43670 RepID=A0A7W4YAJ3_9CELL|nr:maltose ABC transporter substrate-binding protein [Cellulomonas cellasea]MBB2922810.1 arabinogalactan oligomer/maltooligosaccharide transport system substrate-binding protein [Cellulomonas cellasea]